MNELQRLHYLDAMGIEQFVPRKLLAHAAISRLCELSDFEDTTVVEPLEIVAEERVLPKAADVVNRLLDTETKTIKVVPEQSQNTALEENTPGKTAAAELTATVQNADPVQKTEAVRFSLAVWHLQNGVLVLDSHEPRAALPTEKLLANILLAAGLLNLNLPKKGRLNWPVNPELPTEGGWQAAREYFEAYLDAAHQKLAIKRVLVFGAEALKALVDEGDAEQKQFTQGFNLPLLDASGMYFPSLATLLRHPEYKALVWRGLLRNEMKVD